MPKSSLEFMDKIREEGSVVSVMTKIELLSFSASPKEHDSLKAFLEKSSVINLGEEIIEETNFSDIPSGLFADIPEFLLNPCQNGPESVFGVLIVNPVPKKKLTLAPRWKGTRYQLMVIS